MTMASRWGTRLHPGSAQHATDPLRTITGDPPELITEIHHS